MGAGAFGAEIPPEKPFIFIRGEGGGIHKLDLPLHEAIAGRMRSGHIQRVNEDGSPIVVGDGESSVPGLVDAVPAKSAVKADWVSWAVRCGADPDDAQAATKQDLIDFYANKVPGILSADGEDPAPKGSEISTEQIADAGSAQHSEIK